MNIYEEQNRWSKAIDFINETKLSSVRFCLIPENDFDQYDEEAGEDTNAGWNNLDCYTILWSDLNKLGIVDISSGDYSGITNDDVKVIYELAKKHKVARGKYFYSNFESLLENGIIPSEKSNIIAYFNDDKDEFPIEVSKFGSRRQINSSGDKKILFAYEDQYS
jgi:hypothetical protein